MSRFPRSAPFLTVILLAVRIARGEPAAPVNPDPARFEKEIAAFQEEHTPAGTARPVVFLGSSTIRTWETLGADFPGFPVVNRGFGGSHLSDVNAWFDQLLPPLKPAAVVLYEGDNDLAKGKSTAQVLADFDAFRERMHRQLPGVPVAVLAVKPSPSREHLLAIQKETNARLRSRCEADAQFSFIDVATPLLDANGLPDPLYFKRDRLHMNDNGYHRWRAVLAPWLERLAPTARAQVNAGAAGPRP